MDHQLKQLQDWVSENRHIVLFDGTGVSTESGIPDLRNADGLYHQQYAFPPETIPDYSFFKRNPEEFYQFCCNEVLFPRARPSAAHWKLAGSEAVGKLIAVATQNINGLHQAAGGKTVYELHDSVHRSHYTRRRRFYGLDLLLEIGGVSHCSVCGGVVKPDMVFYKECLDETTMKGAAEAIAGADMLITGGTSLTAYPTVGLIHYYRGDKLALINRSATPYDREAGLVINISLGEALGAIRV